MRSVTRRRSHRARVPFALQPEFAQSMVDSNGRLVPGKFLSAFLDNVYAVCTPEKVLVFHQILEQELQTHSSVSVHHGETQIWNHDGQ